VEKPTHAPVRLKAELLIAEADYLQIVHFLNTDRLRRAKETLVDVQTRRDDLLKHASDLSARWHDAAQRARELGAKEITLRAAVEKLETELAVAS